MFGLITAVIDCQSSEKLYSKANLLFFLFKLNLKFDQAIIHCVKFTYQKAFNNLLQCLESVEENVWTEIVYLLDIIYENLEISGSKLYSESLFQKKLLVSHK